MNARMLFKSRWPSLVILGITSLVCSRVMFAFFSDPEGPNLLIVIVAAAIVYGASLAISMAYSSVSDPKRLSLTVLVQILLVSGAYLLLK